MAAEWAVGVAAKVAGPMVGKLTMGAWQRIALSWLVAWRARRRAKELRLPAPAYWEFRRYLGAGEPLSAFKSADPERIEAMGRSLRKQTFGAAWARLTDIQAKQFVDLLLSAYTHGLSTNEALEIQSATTRAEIKAAHVSPISAFEADLRFVAPVRAKQAEALADSWPAVHRFVREFVATQDPKTALVDWKQHRPAWFGQTSAAALMWMADLASDYGLNDEAIALIDEGLEQGATPADYWRVRRDLLKGMSSPDAQRAMMKRHEGHPLADSISAAIDQSPRRALEILDTWDTPDAPERALKASIRCQLLAANDDIEGAVRLAREALQEDQLTGPAQLAAEYLLQRGSIRDSALHFGDLEASLELALAVRNAIRTWRGPSYRAVATAMQAAQALGNSRKAWSMSQLPPTGEATDQEAKNPEVRKLAIVIAADTRPDEEVRRLLAETGDYSLTRLEAEALMAEHHKDRKRALGLWLKAGDQATTANEQFRIGFQIAMHGAVPPRMEALSADHRDIVSDLKLVAAAFSDVPGQFEALRTRARKQRTLAFALYRYFELRSEFEQAAKAAANAAKQWSDAELWHIASNAYLRAGDRKAALTSARSALQVAQPSWGKYEAVYANLIELLSADGRWGEAADAAADLMTRDPSNPAAVWALVECQVRLGQLDDAWKTYAEFGGKPSPRNEREAVLRIQLWRRYQLADGALHELLEVLDAFNNSKQVRAVATMAMLFPTAELPEPVAEQIRIRLEELLPSLEDVFIPQKIDLENPLEALNGLVAQLPDTSDVDRQVEEGKLPFGVAASVHHSSYVELLASRTGIVFAGDATTFEDEVAAARGARDSDAVVDVTALLTLDLFDTELGEQLLGYFGENAVPLEQFLDTIQAVEKLSQRSTMSIGKSREGTAQIHQISEREAEQRFERAKHVHARFQNVRTQERSADTNIPRLHAEEEVFVWLTALDLALDEPPRPLWCDDVKVRQLAVAMGAAAFGTSALVEAMRLDQILSDDLATALQAILISRHYVGAPFRRDWLEAAADLDGWRAGGCASFIMWAPATANPESQVKFAMEGLRRSSDEPDSVKRWVEATSRWLIRVGDKEAYSNLVLYLQRLLAQPWITSAQLPFVLAGIRAATSSAEVADPFEAALTSHYQDLAEKAGPALASRYVRGFVHLTNADDRSMTNRIILTS
ncbi:tetratricopeptide repeat protein [Arthrobacter sp. RHLT1-20]